MNKQELIDELSAKAKENGQKAARWSDHTDKNYFIGIQCGYDRSAKLVDQLDEPEHEKVILPQAVGEEIDNYKSHDKWFKDYIEDVFSGQDYMYAITYLANDNKLEILADAWRYGWKPEKEPRWYVKVNGRFSRPTYYTTHCSNLAFGYLEKDFNKETDYPAQKFTEFGIKFFGLTDCEREEVTDDGMGC